MAGSGDLTHLLQQWRAGDDAAEEALFRHIYPNLRAIVSKRLRGSAQASLQTTEVAHEVYLRLSKQDRVEWQNREHFFAIAARLTRRAIIDYIRLQQRQKRGGDWQRVTLSDVPGSDLAITDILSLNRCLDRLCEVNGMAAQVVEMRYFADYSVDEVALALEVSPATIARRWRFARAWLKKCLASPEPEQRQSS